MADAQDIAAKAEVVRRLLADKFGVKGPTLERALTGMGRRWPRRMQAQARRLAEAEVLTAHPKLARQVDMAAMQRGYDEVVSYLKAIDLAERRKDRLLGLAGVVAFNVLLVGAAFVVWLWWRGYV